MLVSDVAIQLSGTVTSWGFSFNLQLLSYKASVAALTQTRHLLLYKL